MRKLYKLLLSLVFLYVGVPALLMIGLLIYRVYSFMFLIGVDSMCGLKEHSIVHTGRAGFNPTQTHWHYFLHLRFFRQVETCPPSANPHCSNLSCNSLISNIQIF